MNNKKKQTAVVAMATVLSVTTIASPLPVRAQEDTPVPPAIIQHDSEQQKNAPDISLPENLQATAGTALKAVALPDHWAWADDSTVITAETTEYPARFSVDDAAFDYNNVEGYNAKGHYVERMVALTVKPAKQEQASQYREKQAGCLEIAR